jgi:hypothetical protein
VVFIPVYDTWKANKLLLLLLRKFKDRVCRSRVGSSPGCLCDTISHSYTNAFSYIIYFQAGRKWPSPRIIPITIKVSIPVWKALVAKVKSYGCDPH